MGSLYFSVLLTKNIFHYIAQEGFLLTQNHYPLYTFEKVSEP